MTRDPDILPRPTRTVCSGCRGSRRVAWVGSDLRHGGAEVAPKSPSGAKRVVPRRGGSIELKPAVECEYFLIAPDGRSIADPADHQSKPATDQQALMRRYDVVAEIYDAMVSLGWKPYQNDHEDANGPVRNELGVRHGAAHGRQAPFFSSW